MTEEGIMFAITGQQIENWKMKDHTSVLKLDPSRLRWTPHIRGLKGRGEM
jgi:hypothetical protein